MLVWINNLDVKYLLDDLLLECLLLVTHGDNHLASILTLQQALVEPTLSIWNPERSKHAYKIVQYPESMTYTGRLSG